MKTKKINFIIVILLFISFTLPYGCDKSDDVTVIKPVADFISNQSTVDLGAEIQFTDQSTNSPENWTWDFGDGATSSSQNPSHVYTTAGTYTVSLTVTNTSGSDTRIRTNYITVTDSNSNYSLIVKMVDNALNGDLGQIDAEIELAPGVYSFEIETTTAKFGTNQSPWEGVFLYTHELISSGKPAPNFMTTLNGIGNIKTIDLSNASGNIAIQGFMVPNVPTNDDSGEVKIKITNNSTNDILYLLVSMVDNALNGDLGQISSEVTLPPGKYNFSIESTSAKFGTTQTPWEGVFLYTHELISSGKPAPNYMTSLNGIGNIKTIDLSNASGHITIQGFMIPNVPTNDDSGEVKITIVKIDKSHLFCHLRHFNLQKK